MKILVVDDEKLLVKGIKFNLENDGYEVVTGADGMDAVELAAAAALQAIPCQCAAGFSLGEIAEQEGISRQGVRDAILRGQTLLGDMEHKLGLHRRAKLAGDCLGRLRAALKDALLQPEDRWALTQCIDELERALQA